jgi:hypothetical protein
MYPHLTEETISYVINGVDRNINLSTPTGDAYSNIYLTDDWGIQMGSS